MLYVTDPETQLHKKGGQFLVCRGQDVLTHIPLEKLDGVVLFGGVQASSQAMITLLQGGVSTLRLSQKGGYYGRLEPASQQEKAACQRKQFRLSEQSAWRLSEEHFANPDEHGGVYLHPEGRRIFLKEYEAKMNQESSYSGANISYRQALQRQVTLLYRAIETGDVADYHPFLIR